MEKIHHYQVTTTWQEQPETANRNVRTYNRSHYATISGKPLLELTTDNAAVGDKSKWNPEDLLLTALSSCHMLSYLYVCALEGVVITSYTDHATGSMAENTAGGGHFSAATLNPVCTVADAAMVERAIHLHHKAHEVCYIANSVNFEVRCNPVVTVG